MAVRIGNIITGNVCKYTKISFNTEITTTYIDGTTMDDSKVDNVMYFKNKAKDGGGYSKRPFFGYTHIDWWGAKGDALYNSTTNTFIEITDDTAVFQKALLFCAAAKCELRCNTRKKYVVENLDPKRNTAIKGDSAGNYRFGGPDATPDGCVWLVHKAGSTNPCINNTQPGATLKNLFIHAQNNTNASTVKIANGFESHMENVRIAYCSGTGLEINGLFNVNFNRVYVDNCGTATLPAVTINSVPPATVNTVFINGLTIERSQNTALWIGKGTNASRAYPEFVFFTDVHTENPTDNGGHQNTDAQIIVENSREVYFTSCMLYGGPGPIIEVRRTEPTLGSALGGLSLVNCSLLGRDVGSGFQPANLVHLVSGDWYTSVGTTYNNCSASPILIESTFGQNVNVPTGNQILKRFPGNLIQDLRTNGNPYRLDQPLLQTADATFRGHIKSSDVTWTGSVAAGAQAGTSPPAPVAVGGSNDSSGHINFGTGTSPSGGGGGMVVVTFAKVYSRTPKVFLQPTNPATSNLGYYPISTTSGFTFLFSTGAAASQSVGAYQFDYWVIE